MTLLLLSHWRGQISPMMNPTNYLQKEIEKTQNDIQFVESQTIYDMWEYDLNNFEEEYDKYVDSLRVAIDKKRKLQTIKLPSKKPKK